MKKMMLLAFLALFGVSIASAALTAKDLTPKAIRTAVAAKPTAQRQEYARQMIDAVAAIPQDEEARTKALTTTVRALIAGSRTGGGMGVIIEAFNTIPVTNLQGVSDLLARNNFGQKLNGMTDEQYDAFAVRVVTTGARYIQSSGTDSPTLRISILVATFVKSSSELLRTRPKLIGALPTMMQEPATAFILASEANNVDVIAAAAGVDEVTPTPEDPDADDVVQPKDESTTATAENADEASAESADATDGETTISNDDTAATTAEDVTDVSAEDDVSDNGEGEGQAPVVTDIDPASDPEAQVPLLGRLVQDVLGQTIDAMRAATYEWDTIEPSKRHDDPVISVLPGVDNVTDVPGDATVTVPVAPSDPYGNQETY